VQTNDQGFPAGIGASELILYRNDIFHIPKLHIAPKVKSE